MCPENIHCKPHNCKDFPFQKQSRVAAIQVVIFLAALSPAQHTGLSFNQEEVALNESLFSYLKNLRVKKVRIKEDAVDCVLFGGSEVQLVLERKLDYEFHTAILNQLLRLLRPVGPYVRDRVTDFAAVAFILALQTISINNHYKPRKSHLYCHLQFLQTR